MTKPVQPTQGAEEALKYFRFQLNAPIVSIQCDVARLLGRPMDGEQVEELLQAIQQNADKLWGIHQNMKAALSTVPPEQSDEAVAREIAIYETRHGGLVEFENAINWDDRLKHMTAIIARHVQARTAKLESVLRKAIDKLENNALGFIARGMPHKDVTAVVIEARAALAERGE